MYLTPVAIVSYVRISAYINIWLDCFQWAFLLSKRDIIPLLCLSRCVPTPAGLNNNAVLKLRPRDALCSETMALSSPGTECPSGRAEHPDFVGSLWGLPRGPGEFCRIPNLGRTRRTFCRIARGWRWREYLRICR